MKKTYQWILKRAAALAIALIMALSAVPAATASSADWNQTEITVSWVDAYGESRSVTAYPAAETAAGEGCFWAMLPADAPLYALTFSAFHPMHEYVYTPGSGEILQGVTDAGTILDTGNAVKISVFDPNTGMTEVEILWLFVSTVTNTPITPEEAQRLEEEERQRQEEEQRRLEEEERQRQEEEQRRLEEEERQRQEEEQRRLEEEERQRQEEEQRRLDEEAAKNSEEKPTDTPTETATAEPVMPIGEMINRYGVTTSKVNYRKGPSTSEGKYSELPVDTHVYLIYTQYYPQENGEQEAWTLVEAEGHTGYLMSRYLRILSQEESNAWNYAQPTAAPYYSMEDIFPTEAPTEAPAEKITEAPTEAPTEIPTEKAEPTEAPIITEGVMINRYGKTTAGKLALREHTNTKGDPIARLDKDVMVYLLRAELNDAGESWTYVEYKGQNRVLRGYIKTEYLIMLTEEDSRKYDEDQPSPAPVYTEEEVFPTETPTEAPTEIPTESLTEAPSEIPTEVLTEAPTEIPTETPTFTPEPTPTQAPEIPIGEMINRYGKTNSKVYFRKEASTNAGKQGQLAKNTYVYMIYTQENDIGEVWTYSMVNGKTGYIMTDYLDLLTDEDSNAWNDEQKTPAPAFTIEDIFPTAVPTEVVTMEVTDEPTVAPTDVPVETPTEAPTEAPTETPTETPTEAPTEALTEAPTEAPTEVPTETPTEAPTEVPTEAPTAVPTVITTEVPVAGPTQEPYQRKGYAITIGDGIPVREWPTASSSIREELPVNKVVFVTGQVYVDNVAWSVAEYDGKWGYVRADLLRMISEGEMQAYKDLFETTVTPAPNVTPAPYTYDPQEMSCYGYVTTDAVNFRAEASSSSRRIKLMKKYALFTVYGSVQADGETWYKVSYNNQNGYVNGKYFKQMTVGEAEEFLSSTKYQEGLNNNSDQNTSSNSTPVTTGSPTGIVSAEDQKVSEWINPATGSTVSYEPFDPFATPEPLAENELEKNEFVNSLIKQIENGSLKQEDVQTELEKFYKDAADPEGSVSKAMTFIQEKTEDHYIDSLVSRVQDGTLNPGETKTELEKFYKGISDSTQAVTRAIGIIKEKTGLTLQELSESPEPEVTAETPEYRQEENTGSGTGWLIGLGLLGAAGGGGYYYWTLQRKRKRDAAQRMAKQRVAQQNRSRTAPGASQNGSASAQNSARVRTGTYTGNGGTVKPKATPAASADTKEAKKTYSAGSKNPYRRYSRGETDEDPAYTASFKPESSKKDGIQGSKNNDQTDA